MTGSSERPLSRWSRLKREQSAAKRTRGSAAPKEETADSKQTSLPTERLPERARKESAPDVDKALPSVESLTKDSDFTAFMKPGVPDDVSRAAMRKLWQSDPAFAAIDPLHDCFGDYRNFPLITAKDTIYQVGKGIIDWAASDEKETAAVAEREKAAPESKVPEDAKPGTQTAGQAAPPAAATGPDDSASNATPAGVTTPKKTGSG